MELKEIKRERKEVTMTIRTSKAKSDWMRKHEISPALLFDRAIVELKEKLENKEVKQELNV